MTQYLSRLVTALTGTKWIKVLDLCTVLFQVTTIFTSCHFTCMHQRGVPAILMADDITKFIIFFFILIQSCKITIYIFSPWRTWRLASFLRAMLMWGSFHPLLCGTEYFHILLEINEVEKFFVYPQNLGRLICGWVRLTHLIWWWTHALNPFRVYISNIST